MPEDLLFLTQRIPFPPNKGEKIRTFHMLRHLSRSWRIHLGCLVDEPEDLQHIDELRRHVTDAHCAHLNPRAAKLTCLSGLATGAPLSFAYFANAGLRRWTRHVLEQVRPRAALICSSNMAQYVVGNGPRPSTVIADFVDVDSEKWRAYAENGNWPMRSVYAREHLKVLGQEEAIAEYADAVSLVSEAEACLFRDMFPHLGNKVHGISNGVDPDYFSPEHGFAPPYDTGRAVYVFCGTMDYLPNIEAVTWFAGEVLPIIRRSLPDAEFYVVGARPSPAVLALNSRDGVTVTGRVDDVRPYVAHATASVAPMKVARGIQNKVLEAMAMAKPVIVSADGLEGIAATPGRDVVVAETAEQFADAALRCHTEGAGELGASARRLVVDHYSWAAHMIQFDELLSEHPEPAQLAS